MKTPRCLQLSLTFLLLSVSGNLFALAPDVAVSEATIKFYQGSYTEVLGLLAQSAAEYKDTSSKSTLSDAYTLFAVEESSIKNYKNAYECFKEALKLTPTNQAATQGYLTLRKEQDVNNLRNLGNRLSPMVVAEVPNPVSTMNTSKSDSDSLKKQLEDQRLLVETMINPQIRAPDNASVQEPSQNTQPSSPQGIVQPDPVPLQKLDHESANNSEFKMMDLVNLLSLILLGLLLVVIFFFVFIASRRNRRLAPFHERFLGVRMSYPMQNSAPALSHQNEREKPALLDFVDQSGKSSEGKDLSLRSALMKADRLKKCMKRFEMES